MLKFVKGQNGGGDRVEIEIEELMTYDISLKDLQEILQMAYECRENHASQKRIWITHKNKPLAEFGVCEVKKVLDFPYYRLNEFQKESQLRLVEFMVDHKIYFEKLDKTLLGEY